MADERQIGLGFRLCQYRSQYDEPALGVAVPERFDGGGSSRQGLDLAYKRREVSWTLGPPLNAVVQFAIPLGDDGLTVAKARSWLDAALPDRTDGLEAAVVQDELIGPLTYPVRQ